MNHPILSTTCPSRTFTRPTEHALAAEPLAVSKSMAVKSSGTYLTLTWSTDATRLPRRECGQRRAPETGRGRRRRRTSCDGPVFPAVAESVTASPLIAAKWRELTGVVDRRALARQGGERVLTVAVEQGEFGPVHATLARRCSGAAAPLDQSDTQVQCGAVDDADAAHGLGLLLGLDGWFVTSLVRQRGVHDVPHRESGGLQTALREGGGSTTGVALEERGRVADGAWIGPRRAVTSGCCAGLLRERRHRHGRQR